MPRECTGHSKHPLPTTQEKTLHKMVNNKIRLIIFFATKDREALYSQQKQDRELTGSDYELLIAKFRLKLKKVGKTTRPFRYDLNQIPYDYTVEVSLITFGFFIGAIHAEPSALMGKFSAILIYL